MSRDTQLLPDNLLVRTGPIDHADWNYRFALGWLQRRRFALIQSLLPPGRVDQLLEIGYGSGIFMPELARRCVALHGIDVHAHHQEVAARLSDSGVRAALVFGSAERLPYADQAFDCLVAVSSLEFIENIDAATREMRRVLRPDGQLVFVTPASSPLLDGTLRLLTGANAKQDFALRRERLLPALNQCFRVEQKRCFPPLISRLFSVYKAFRMT